MKKTSLIIAAVLLALSACTKNEVRSISDEPMQITWQTVVGPKSTKALVDGTIFDKAYKFKSCAFYNANGTTWPENASLYINNEEVSYHISVGSTIPRYWGTTNEYYWPKGGSLTFISYTVIDSYKKATSYPANLTCDAENGLKVIGYEVDRQKDLDFMVAYATNQNASTATSNAGVASGVPTLFQHALTQISGFKVSTMGEYKKVENGVVKAGSYEFKINNIKLVNPYNKGDYSLKNDAKGAWSSTAYAEEADARSTYVYKTSDGKPAELHQSPYIDLTCEQKAFLPQTFAEVNYEFKGKTPLEKARERRTQAYINELKKVPYVEFSYSVSYYGEDDKISFTDQAIDYVSLEEMHPYQGWEMNKKIIYDLSINITGIAGEMIIYWDPTVSEWEEDMISSYI